MTAEAAGAAVERVFRDYGQPTAYIAGEEASGAITFGLRYGRGLLYMKERPALETFWQGPTVGFDLGGNASRVFTLCYNLQYPDAIFRRYPAWRARPIGRGLGVNYQRAEAHHPGPIRAGVVPAVSQRRLPVLRPQAQLAAVLARPRARELADGGSPALLEAISSCLRDSPPGSCAARGRVAGPAAFASR